MEVLPSGVPYPLWSQNVYPDGVFIEDYVRIDRREAELDYRLERLERASLATESRRPPRCASMTPGGPSTAMRETLEPL
ncbi:MAG: hypothetical protein MZV65_10975 [Chromatiales bacterium]|nr:hypothetical protein [Chromatiales bacterium]